MFISRMCLSTLLKTSNLGLKLRHCSMQCKSRCHDSFICFIYQPFVKSKHFIISFIFLVFWPTLTPKYMRHFLITSWLLEFSLSTRDALDGNTCAPWLPCAEIENVGGRYTTLSLKFSTTLPDSLENRYTSHI